MLGDEAFRTLRGFIAERRNGQIFISRTTSFAEARIRMKGKQYLLCAPLTTDAIAAAEPVARAVRQFDSRAFTEYRILRNEMIFSNSAGCSGRCDLILHELPEGEPLDTAVTHIATDALSNALEMLRSEFLRTGFLHGNLKPANLIYGDDGRLYPIRYHYARTGASAEDTDAEIAAVKDYISSFPFIPAVGETFAEPYGKVSDPRFDEVAPMHDMMRRVRAGELYGFMDAEGATVIEPVFRYAEDFRENRAVVETGEGMGVIDRRGRFIIEPRYDIVEFDPERGDYTVKCGAKWARFDYLGCITEEFHETKTIEK